MTTDTFRTQVSQTDRLVDAVEQAILAEIDEWGWESTPRLRQLVTAQLLNGGKRLRPRLAFAFTGLHGGDPADVIAPAASVELYHLASLVLDDLQDNAALRNGRATVHMSASASTAINVAATIRSLSYHLIHRSERLTDASKLRLHRELDVAATRLARGQSIDIGWNCGWYTTPADYPYLDMARGKTGALFGYAAALAAVSAGAPDAAVDAARELGVLFGVLYQQINDYLDMFGGDGALGRPGFEDLCGGKLTAPVLTLLDTLRAEGRLDEADLVVVRLAERTAVARAWLLDLMARCNIAARLGAGLVRQAERLAALLPADAAAERRAGVENLLDSVLARVGAVRGPNAGGCP